MVIVELVFAAGHMPCRNDPTENTTILLLLFEGLDCAGFSVGDTRVLLQCIDASIDRSEKETET